MKTMQCPQTERLAEWLAEQIQGPDRESIEKHVLQCEPCSALALAMMHGGDPSLDETVRSEITRVELGEVDSSSTDDSLLLSPPPLDTSFLDPAQNPDELGRLGDFRVLKVLGHGGMGIVFLAQDVRLGRRVAIKTMKPSRAESAEMRARFLREARAAAALENDYIVPIFHVAEQHGVPFIAMPVLKGESLETRIKRESPLTQTDVLRIGRDIAQGLAAAHEHGLVHRDIKPANIWLDEKADRAKILDFGLVCGVTDDSDVTQTGKVVGTPQYMSPEQALGHPVDYRSDLFSLGVVLYYLASGQRPFHGSSVTAILIGVAHNAPVALHTLAPGLHPRLLELVMQLLEKNPGQRPDRAERVAEQLAEILSEVAATTAPARPPNKPARKRWLAAGAGALALLCTLIVITISNRDGTETVLRVTAGSVTDIEVAPDSVLKIQEQTDPVQSQLAGPERADTSELAVLSGTPLLADADAPLAHNATVHHPAPIPGVRSWTIELKSHYHPLANAFTWSPRGDVFATGSQDESVRLWDDGGELRSILLGHTGPTVARSFSPDGQWLATTNIEGYYDSTLRVWRVDNGDCVKAIPLVDWGWFVAWSPDGTKIAYDDERRKCKILDLHSGAVTTLKVTSEPLEVYQYVWSNDSQTLALESSGGLAIYDVASGEKRKVVSTPAVSSERRDFRRLAKSSDGRLLASPLGGKLRIWDFDKLRYLRSIDSGFDKIDSIAWHPVKPLLAVTGSGGKSPACLIDADSGAVAPCPEWTAGHSKISWSAADDELISDFGRANRISFINARTGEMLRQAPDEGRMNFFTTSLTGAGKRIVSGNRDFDAATGKLISQHDDLPGELILVAPDDSWRAYQSSATEVILRTTEAKPSSTTLSVSENSLVWRTSQSGETVAQAIDKQVTLWNASSGSVVAKLKHPAPVWTMEFSADGKQIATLCGDKTLRIWDIHEQQEIGRCSDLDFPDDIPVTCRRGNRLMQWTSDGSLIWLVLKSQLIRINTDTGKIEQQRKVSPIVHAHALELSPDNRQLLVTDAFYRATLFNLDADQTDLSHYFTDDFQWYPDSRHFLTGGPRQQNCRMGVRVYDCERKQKLGTLFPHLSNEHWLCVGPTGHYRGSAGVESQFVYVAQLEDGSNLTLNPDAFAERFGWTNDPAKATLLRE